MAVRPARARRTGTVLTDWSRQSARQQAGGAPRGRVDPRGAYNSAGGARAGGTVAPETQRRVDDFLRATRGQGAGAATPPAIAQESRPAPVRVPLARGAAPGARGYSYSPPGMRAPVNAYNYTPGPDGRYQTYAPGLPAPRETPQYNSWRNPAPPNPMQQTSAMQDYLRGSIERVAARGAPPAESWGEQRVAASPLESMTRQEPRGMAVQTPKYAQETFKPPQAPAWRDWEEEERPMANWG